MLSRSKFGCGAFLCGALLLFVESSVLDAQQYDLTNQRDPAKSSTAVLNGNALTVTDWAGNNHNYQRNRRHDSARGDYLGFTTTDGRNSLRWPSNRTGAMQILDSRTGRWNPSSQSVSLAQTRGGTGRGKNNPTAGTGAGRPRLNGFSAFLNSTNPGNPRNRTNNQGRGNQGQNNRANAGNPGRGGPNNPPLRVNSQTRIKIVNGAVAGQALIVAIDLQGQIIGFSGSGNQWQSVTFQAPPNLLANGDFVIRNLGANRVSVITVDRQGILWEIPQTGQNRQLPLPNTFRLTPGSALALAPNQNSVALIDQAGVIRILDLVGRAHIDVDPRRNALYPPGCSLDWVLMQGVDQIFATDNTGEVVGYALAPPAPWNFLGPIDQNTANNYVPGSYVRAIAFPTQSGVLAVDRTGLLTFHQISPTGIITSNGAGTSDLYLPGGRVTYGFFQDRRTRSRVLSFNGVATTGIWRESLVHNNTGNAAFNQLGLGFPSGAYCDITPNATHAVCIDRQGRIVVATAANRGPWNKPGGDWSTYVITNSGLGGPGNHPPLPVRRLIKQEFIPNPPLPPVDVTFENKHTNPLVVKLFEADGLRKPRAQTLETGKSITEKVERDPGGVMEELWEVPLRGGGFREVVEKYPVPPQPLYALVVYEDYVLLESKPNPKAPLELQKNLIQRAKKSLGVLMLPPGDSLKANEVFDVYGEVKRENNPGATAFFEQGERP